MKLYQVKCLTCGSPIDPNLSSNRQHCESCKNNFLSIKKEDLVPKIYINKFSSDNIQELAKAAYFQDLYAKNQLESTTIYQIKKNLESLWNIFAELEMDENFTNLDFQIKGLEKIIEIQELLFKN